MNSYKYDEFGNKITQQEKTSNPFKYAGEYLDSESGLYYLNARYYNPSMGRFLNEDTVEGQIGNPLTLNIYAYVNNNPMGYVDPTGHITESYNDGALRNLLQDARSKVKSKSSELYGKYKAKVTEVYGNFTDENTYNYLFDLTTKTSTYGNSDGKSDWAIEQLVSTYKGHELAEYIVTLAMGSMGGSVGSGGNKGKGSSLNTQVNGKTLNLTNGQARDLAKYLGFKEVKGQKVQGELVFTNKKTFITIDNTSHNGGIWKQAKTIKELGNKNTRMGTYDAILNKIGG